MSDIGKEQKMSDQIGDRREEPGFEGVPQDVLEEKIKLFREILFEERAKIFQNAQRTLTEDMTIDANDLSDEVDRTAFEQNQALAFRLRGRERQLLNKIEDSLKRIETGKYWWCDDCGAWIGFNRLKARPVTTLCILCKEKRERKERSSHHKKSEY
jgi:DnaK suppressor protein